jgi:hypothetical protein
MIRFAALQSATQTAVALLGVVAITIAAAVTGPDLVHIYNSTVASCASDHDCGAATTALFDYDSWLRHLLGYLILGVPVIVGMFWAAPLVAAELETGTYRLAWTQSVTRGRWLAVKLAVVGLASVALAGLLSLIITRWASPLDRATTDRWGTFDQRDIVPLAYAAFAFALGVTAGVLIRRTRPAMITTLVGFVAARFAITQLRPHLIAPAHLTVALTSEADLGLSAPVATPTRVTLIAHSPNIPNTLITGSTIVDNSGHAATPQALRQFIQRFCPTLLQRTSRSTGSGPQHHRAGAGGLHAFHACIAKLSTHYHVLVTGQPLSHYWPLQWAEAAVFLSAALILTACCYWWTRTGLT